MKKTLKNALSGIAIGIVNGMLGAGGGMVAVPLLKKSGMEQKQAHANAVAVILPISVVSAVIYLINGQVRISDAIGFMPSGVAGSVVATLLLKKISPKYLKIIFGAFMVWAGIRMLMK